MSQASKRLAEWADDTQLSARLGFPQYANPGELKKDIRTVLLEVEKMERVAAAAKVHVGDDVLDMWRNRIEGFTGAFAKPEWRELVDSLVDLGEEVA